MYNRRRILRAAAAVSFLLATAASLADPPSITSLATQPNLDQQDREKISEYGRYWCQRLSQAGDASEEVRRARRRLIDPVNVPGTTAMFLSEYDSTVRPALGAIIDGGSPELTSNAVIVLSYLATERALEALLDRCDRHDEERFHVRLGAARGCKVVLGSERLSSFNAKRITSAARQLREAVRAEDNSLVMRHQLEAILEADSPVLPEGPREQVRGYLVEALESAAERSAAESGGLRDGLVEAIYPVVLRVRDAYLRLDVGAQESFGRKLGPCLAKVLDSPRARWEQVQDGAGPKERYGRAIGLCESFLQMVDIIIRPEGQRSAKLKSAWESGDMAQYESILARWREIVDRPPY